MKHSKKIEWMAVWCAHNNLQLKLKGECGFGRECVGASVEGHFPDYRWYNNDFEREDANGDVWVPGDAYHKHECVAVLGRGEKAESQLYDWLKWFDDNGFVVETGDQAMDPGLGTIGILLGQHRYARMVRQLPEKADG